MGWSRSRLLQRTWMARSSGAAGLAVVVLSLASCSSLAPIKAGYPEQIPVAAKLVPPPGFGDVTDAGPGARLDGHVLVSCPADFDFGCTGANVVRSWESVGSMSAQEACQRFGIWSYNHGLREFNYATYPGGVQTYHVLGVSSPTSPKFHKFVSLCVQEADLNGADVQAASSDLLRPNASGLQPQDNASSGKSWVVSVGFPNPPKPQSAPPSNSNPSSP
jgi:hypothetical protein